MTDLYDLYERQKNQGKPRMERFWICWVAGTDGGEHYRHSSLVHAEKEAERLARLPNVQGKAVYLFECKGKCYIEQSPVRWKVPH